MSAGFTKGPWEAIGSHIYAPDGAIIATVSNPGSKATDYPLVANRAVMRAAPELYEAADLLASFDATGDEDFLQDAIRAARAALARARGEP